jgi:hypothetical protein
MMTVGGSLTFDQLYQKAQEAGNAAAAAMTPTPMVVVGNNFREVVYDGACGFAWVNVKPGTSKFARWLKAKGYARPDSYYGGVCIWVSQFNQSVERKEAYARAMAHVFSEAGIKAYAASRLD